jgi:hypothetical protein
VLELRRAIPFLAIPMVAFALAVLVSGCGFGSPSTASTTAGPTVAPTASAPSAPNPTPVAAITESPKPAEGLDRIARHRATWEAAGIDTYRISLRFGCFCNFGDGRPLDVQVVDGKVVAAAVNGEPVHKRDWRGFPMTVDALFDYAVAAKADADEFDIEFDRTLGYPSVIDVDQIRNADDDEFRVDVTRLVPGR